MVVPPFVLFTDARLFLFDSCAGKIKSPLCFVRGCAFASLAAAMQLATFALASSHACAANQTRWMRQRRHRIQQRRRCAAEKSVMRASCHLPDSTLGPSEERAPFCLAFLNVNKSQRFQFRQDSVGSIF
jgi:hypothetical protein